MKNACACICSFVFLFLFSITSEVYCAVNAKNCEVCVKFIERLKAAIPSAESSDQAKIEKYFKDMCKKSKGKDESFCYYIGGLETSATYIVNELVKPVSWGMPAEKVCEKLKALDSQICELKYDKPVDLTEVDLNKARVKELKKILESWGEVCSGCTEKSDFIRLIKEKMPIHDPQAAAARQKNEL